MAVQKEAEKPKEKRKELQDQAYLNNLRAMKVKIPARVDVPEPFRQASKSELLDKPKAIGYRAKGYFIHFRVF